MPDNEQSPRIRRLLAKLRTFGFALIAQLALNFSGLHFTEHNFVAANAAAAQSAPNATHEPALDTLKLGANERAIYRVWNAYLISKAGRLAQRLEQQSPYWLMAEQKQLPMYDLAAAYLADDAVPRIISIKRKDARSDSVYRITTRFYAAGGPATADPWRNAMTVTTFAVRDGGQWKLSGALLRNTTNWKRDRVGQITYVYAPSYPFNRSRALRAVTFADSLASALGVPKLSPITYFLASTTDACYALMGLESDVKYGAAGAAAQPVNRMLFSGVPKWGEEYRHELVHLVVAPLTANTMYFFNEGIATWLGGTVGLTYEESLRDLGVYLRDHPEATIDSFIDTGMPQTQLYRGGALLSAMVFERGGTAGLKTLFDASPGNEFRTAVSRVMRQPWSAVAQEWRKRALNYASTVP